VLVVAFMVFSACIQPVHTPTPTPIRTVDPRQPSASPKINLLKKVSITTDAEGGNARREIVTTIDRVFVVYLGNISKGGK